MVVILEGLEKIKQMHIFKNSYINVGDTVDKEGVENASQLL